MLHSATSRAAPSLLGAAQRWLALPALALALLSVTLAFWWSLASLGGLTLAESPLGLALVTPLLALFAAGHSALRLRGAPRDASDPFLDRALAIPCFAAAFLLLRRGGDGSDWYYWLQRWDLLAVPLWAYGTVLVLWGFGTLRLHWRPALFALLIWPAPLLWIHEQTSPLLSQLSAALARPIADGLGVALAPVGADPTHFVSANPANPFTIVIAAVCSGDTTMVGIFLMGLLALTMTRGRWLGKAAWLATGALLALGSNVLRIALLLAASSWWGARFGLGVVHPALGLLLLGPVAVAFWALQPRFGVQPLPVPAPPPARQWLARGGAAAPALSVVLLALALYAAWLDGGLRRFADLNPEQATAFQLESPEQYLAALPGWQLEADQPIAWQNLFGPASHAQLFNYSSAATPWTVVQFVVTPDGGALDRYTVEQCGVYHGADLVRRTSVDLGSGQTGTLIETRSHSTEGPDRILHGSLVYWQAPVEVQGQLQHVRVVLLLDTEAQLGDLGPDAGVSAVTGSDPDTTRVDQHLVYLARSIVAANATRAG